MTLEDFQNIVKYDCSAKETSHAIINRDLYVKTFYNEEIKILEEYPETLEARLNPQTGELQFFMKVAYVAKGAEYMLVQRNYLDKKMLAHFKKL